MKEDSVRSANLFLDLAKEQVLIKFLEKNCHQAKKVDTNGKKEKQTKAG